jgi:hypothetical protein
MSDSIFSSRSAPGHLHARAIPRDAAVPPTPSVHPSLNVLVPTRPVRPSTDVHVPDLPPLRTASGQASTDDAALLAILDAPVPYGMTAREGFMRKEAELRAAVAALPVAGQRALHARRANPGAGEELATKFHQLTAERRTRLLTFLADARRREALATAR